MFQSSPDAEVGRYVRGSKTHWWCCPRFNPRPTLRSGATPCPHARGGPREIGFNPRPTLRSGATVQAVKPGIAAY